MQRAEKPPGQRAFSPSPATPRGCPSCRNARVRGRGRAGRDRLSRRTWGVSRRPARKGPFFVRLLSPGGGADGWRDGSGVSERVDEWVLVGDGGTEGLVACAGHTPPGPPGTSQSPGSAAVSFLAPVRSGVRRQSASPVCRLCFLAGSPTRRLGAWSHVGAGVPGCPQLALSRAQELGSQLLPRGGRARPGGLPAGH